MLHATPAGKRRNGQQRTAPPWLHPHTPAQTRRPSSSTVLKFSVMPPTGLAQAQWIHGLTQSVEPSAAILQTVMISVTSCATQTVDATEVMFLIGLIIILTPASPDCISIMPSDLAIACLTNLLVLCPQCHQIWICSSKGNPSVNSQPRGLV